MKPDPSRAVAAQPIMCARDRSMALPKRSVRSVVGGGDGHGWSRGGNTTNGRRP